eukprot:TRINITY_DN2350_c0_g1_i1.p1 TRINITY_DN2350_c0_g1~~TRINITY_DN2350_c0_g1_i1.p1  ORF type:complete len:179 (+),score=76.10 TRINITY_DN2350_c0_g1_i1:81-617(+)
MAWDMGGGWGGDSWGGKGGKATGGGGGWGGWDGGSDSWGGGGKGWGGDGGGKGWGGKDGGKGKGKMDMMMAMMGWGGKDGKGFKGKGFQRGPGSWGKYEADTSGGILGEFTGTIKSFADSTGYGFISCPDLEAMGYKDAFLHGDEKKGYRVGHSVKFTAFLTGKGTLQGKDLKSGLKE